MYKAKTDGLYGIQTLKVCTEMLTDTCDFYHFCKKSQQQQQQEQEKNNNNKNNNNF